jgi:nickel/cobalt transporter (NicO) family protein
MSSGLAFLCGTAASIALVHTAVGVDHTLPLVALARAGAWSRRKLWLVTLGVGVAHVGSSVLLGIAGIGLGAALSALAHVEAARGTLSAWLLVAFGLTYAVWGFIKQRRGRAHAHVHVHADGTVHSHGHTHEAEHLHPHAHKDLVTFWGLFLIFGLGPCEPLIPLLIVPAHELGWVAAALVALVFAAVTIGTMLVLVTLGVSAVARVPHVGLERHAESLAGLAVAVSGLLVLYAGI